MKKPSCDSLGIDEACVWVNSAVDATFSKQYDECVKCPFTDEEVVKAFHSKEIVVQSVFPVKFLVEAGNSSCITSGHLQEHGFYDLNVTITNPECDTKFNESCLSCELVATSVPSAVSTYLPIIIAACIYFGIAVVFVVGQKLYRMMRRSSASESTVNINSQSHSSNPSINQGEAQEEVVPPPQTRKRLRSLDTFRGLAIVVMIFVNYGGGVYFFFDHLPWNGLSVADLVFPWFIWIMGMSMSMSLRSLIRKSTPKIRIIWKIVKRTVILFSLGIILNTSWGANDLSKLRVPGVLQRFAISYLVVGIIHMCFARPADSHTEVRWSAFRDVVLYWVEWLIMLALLLVYFCLTFLLPVPDCPTGYLGPGGLHENGSYWNCTGGAAGYIDRMFFGPQHIYSKPTCKELYDTTVPYDPEGLLGSVTSIFLVFLGLQAGKILQTYVSWKGRILRWLAWGTLLGVIAAILCKGTQNDGWIPVNKNLWSISFVMVTGCFAFYLLSFCYYIQDVKGWWDGEPFFYAGMNSILLYVGHQLTTTLFPWQFVVPNTHGAQLSMDLWGCSLWVFIAYVLYRKNVFLAI